MKINKQFFNKYQKPILWLINTWVGISDFVIDFLIKPFPKRFKQWFLNWKPIHLCWLFNKYEWKIPKYLIGAGGDVTYGLEYPFNEAGSGFTTVAYLDATHFVAAYRDTGGDTWGHTRIGLIANDDEISYGAEDTPNPVATDSIVVTAIDSTHFVFAYNDTGGSGNGEARIGTVTGVDSVFGTLQTFNTGETSETSIVLLDSTHFVIAYKDSANLNRGTAVIGVISGTNIAFGSEYIFRSANTQDISVTALDSTHFVVAYSDGSTNGTTKIGTVSSGDNISYGDEDTFNTARASSNKVITIDSTHFVVAYQDLGGSGDGETRIGTVTGTDTTFGSKDTFNAALTDTIALSLLDSTHFVVGYRDDGGDDNGIVRIGTISGTDSTFGSEFIFSTLNPRFSTEISSFSNSFVIGYRAFGNSSYGTAIIGLVESFVSAPTVTTQAVSSIDTTTSTGNGNITDDGGDAGATRGMAWDTSPTPIVSGDHATNGTGEGAYTVAMTGLSKSTHYYVRAYSINSAGTSYGSQVEFDTLSEEFTVTVSESVGITENISKLTFYSKSFSELFSITETLSVLKLMIIDVSETIGLTETLSKLTSYSKSFTETFSITETLTVIKRFIINIIESISITETLIKVSAYAKSFSENIGITDVATFIERYWTELTKHTSSWTDKSKNTSNWVNRHKFPH